MPAGPPRVLVVEDNLLIAMEVESMVEDCGCAVVGPAGCVADALQLLDENDLQGAVLDINLGRERVWPVAEILDDRAVPFVLATGYSDAEVPPRFRERVILSKPISREALAAALREIGTLGDQQPASGRRPG